MDIAINTMFQLQELTCPNSNVVGFTKASYAQNTEDQLSSAEPYQPSSESLCRALEMVKFNLEIAYGYRYSDVKKRFHRGASSAGGMYPTDLLVFVREDQRCVIIYYDYIIQEFFLYKQLDQKQSEWFEESVDCAIFVASNFSKSISRYGIRGYRYCLIDAGHVLSSLLNIFNESLSFSKTVCSLSKIDTHLNNLRLLGVASIDLDKLMAHDFKLSKIEIDKIRFPVVRNHPYLSENIELAYKFHDSFLESKQNEKKPSPFVRDYTDIDSCNLLTVRRSANNFNSSAVSLTLINSLIETISGLDLIYESQNNIDIYLLAKNIDGLKKGIYKLNLKNKTLNYLQNTKLPLNEATYLSCQNQKLAYNASFSLLYCLNSDFHNLTHSEVVRSILDIGYIDANTQLWATINDVANSCIGGFSDNVMKILIGNSKTQPIIFHCFGNEMNDINKIDAEYTHIGE